MVGYNHVVLYQPHRTLLNYTVSIFNVDTGANMWGKKNQIKINIHFCHHKLGSNVLCTSLRKGWETYTLRHKASATTHDIMHCLSTTCSSRRHVKHCCLEQLASRDCVSTVTWNSRHHVKHLALSERSQLLQVRQQLASKLDLLKIWFTAMSKCRNYMVHLTHTIQIPPLNCFEMRYDGKMHRWLRG